jgi:adenylate cyclase
VTSGRRLAAIMFTDMVGFTAATQRDEAGTLQLLREQESIVRPVLGDHDGREVKSTGDGFLVEFESALHAVQCAIDIHTRLHARNTRDDVTPISLRIGVHLGDVEEHDSDIFGDSVNLAARIQPVAEPGGICISEPVYGQVRNKITNPIEKLPPKVLKNVQFPMDLYRVVLPWQARGQPVESPAPTGIAILPLANISPDPNDEYFADGLTEEMITALSRLRGLRVIARASVTPYKATSKGVGEIGAELGVSSILEGSVRKSGNRLRITVQLIDVATQAHVWANTYDRVLDDVFTVQGEIAKNVAETLKIELRATESARLEARPTVLPDSYLAYLKGRTLMGDVTPAKFAAAREQFELAIALDPKNAAAHSGLADLTRLSGWFFPDVPREQWDAEARRLAGRAIELDPNLAEAHASLALIQWDDFEWRSAEGEFQIALSLSPSYSSAHLFYASLLEDEGRADAALQELVLAEAADPLRSTTVLQITWLLIWLDRLDEARTKLDRVERLVPDSVYYHLALARYHFAKGDRKRGLRELERGIELEKDPRTQVVNRAQYHALGKEPEKAEALLREEESQPESAHTMWATARAYALLGRTDDAFRWLEKAYLARNLPLAQFVLDPWFEPLRDDPRWEVLMEKHHLA